MTLPFPRPELGQQHPHAKRHTTRHGHRGENAWNTNIFYGTLLAWLPKQSFTEVWRHLTQHCAAHDAPRTAHRAARTTHHTQCATRQTQHSVGAEVKAHETMDCINHTFCRTIHGFWRTIQFLLFSLVILLCWRTIHDCASPLKGCRPVRSHVLCRTLQTRV